METEACDLAINEPFYIDEYSFIIWKLKTEKEKKGGGGGGADAEIEFRTGRLWYPWYIMLKSLHHQENRGNDFQKQDEQFSDKGVALE